MAAPAGILFARWQDEKARRKPPDIGFISYIRGGGFGEQTPNKEFASTATPIDFPKLFDAAGKIRASFVPAAHPHTSLDGLSGRDGPGMDLKSEIVDFLQKRRDWQSECTQLAALRLGCGMDLEKLLAAKAPERAAALKMLQRRLERERLRGLERHWSYDLNRHIAVKQACDRLTASLAKDGPERDGGRAREKPSRDGRDRHRNLRKA